MSVNALFNRPNVTTATNPLVTKDHYFVKEDIAKAIFIECCQQCGLSVVTKVPDIPLGYDEHIEHSSMTIDSPMSDPQDAIDETRRVFEQKMGVVRDVWGRPVSMRLFENAPGFFIDDVQVKIQFHQSGRGTHDPKISAEYKFVIRIKTFRVK